MMTSTTAQETREECECVLRKAIYDISTVAASGKHRSEAHQEGGEEQHLNRKGSEQQRVQTGVIICSLVVDPWWVLDTHQ